MKKPLKITIVILVAATIGIGAFFGARAIYNQGIKDGRVALTTEISDNLTALGTAISEKSEFNVKSSTLLTDVPAEINQEGITQYINNITALRDATKNQEVKSALYTYISDWHDFETVYASENNSAISESLNELKSKAGDLAVKIRTLYDAAITESLNQLK